MRIIDCHTHFFPNKLFRALWRWFENYAWPIEYKLYAADLISVLKAKGVTRAVSLHYPHKPGMAEALNHFVFELANKHPDFLIPFGSLHPDDGNKPSILKTCFEDYGFKGLKFHSHVQRVAADDPRLDEVYACCRDYQRIILFHCGTGPHFRDRPVNGYGYDVMGISGIKTFIKTLKKYPEIVFVVPHLGYEETEDFVCLLDDHPNLYLDTAMAVGNYFPDAKIKREWFEKYADRILFGTDFPHLPYPWERERDALIAMQLGADQQDQIFYRNAARLLGLHLGDSSFHSE